MIDRVIEFSGDHAPLVFLLVAALVALGGWSIATIPMDALPDLSDTQVIVQTRWERSPDIIEAQVTYPIVTAMMGAARVKDVRGLSDFGSSYVYVIFEDGVDLYWARSRTLELLSKVTANLPREAHVEIGPDATGLGWVYQYALVDTTGQHDLSELRSIQDWFLRFQLQSVRGVAEIAPLGGFVRQYQINLDPTRLRARGIPLERVVQAVRSSNNDVAGHLLEMTGREYMIRGKGYLKSARDLEQLVVWPEAGGTPIPIRDLGTVSLGPEPRRGVTDLDGKGEAVSGIVVMRQGEHALETIDRVKRKLKDIQPALPQGVSVQTVYDRAELIWASIENLKITLIEELIVVSLVILVFLWHFPSTLIPVATVLSAVVISFIPMRLMGMTCNIMSLAGIALAVGAMVDASIVIVEQTHKKLEQWQSGDRAASSRSVIVSAMKEVSGPAFFAMLVIAVAFLPVFALESEEGRLFRPLAATKTLAMVAAALLTITLDPALRLLLPRSGKVRREEEHPISSRLIRWYQPIASWSLRWKWVVLGGAVLLMASTIPVYQALGSEFMPPLDEGVLLFMPTTTPGISVPEARRVLQIQDRLLMSVPEVARVFGKAGRAVTATDPAPLSMFETVIQLKPKSQWRRTKTWYDGFPEWTKPVLRHLQADTISTTELIAILDQAVRIPGVSNAWTMPIKNRIEMQATGMRTALGLKVFGSDLKVIEGIGKQIEKTLAPVRGTRTVFAEQLGSGYYLDISFNRQQMARYDLTIDDAEAVITNAIGGETVTTMLDGRERYPVSVRYLGGYRSDPVWLGRALVESRKGGQIPLSQIADIQLAEGPSMLRTENGLLDSYVYVDVANRDLGSYIREADRLIKARVNVPAGYSIAWSGQYEAMERVRQRLWMVVPFTLLLIFVLLYLNTKSMAKALFVLLAAPFSAIGAFWLLYLLGYNLSVGVWVGLIALLGVDAETGVFMLLYLDLSVAEWKPRDPGELREAILHGAVKRIRPKFMTVAAMLLSLLPIMWSSGAGSDVMKRIAAPLIGGIVSSFVLELIIYPVLYQVWRGSGLQPAGIPIPGPHKGIARRK